MLNRDRIKYGRNALAKKKLHILLRRIERFIRSRRHLRKAVGGHNQRLLDGFWSRTANCPEYANGWADSPLPAGADAGKWTARMTHPVSPSNFICQN
jgi:hypothetical protein